MAVAAGLFHAQSSQAQMKYPQEVYVSGGINVPLYDNIGANSYYGVYYGHSYFSGLGFRAGLEYSSSLADRYNTIGLPLALTYRTRSHSDEDKLYSGINSSAASFVNGGSPFWGFLLGLYDQMEFSAGVTPGYVTEVASSKSAFSLTLDAGVSMNFSIWRFELKLMPAVHYSVLDLYKYPRSTFDQPLSWFFSFGAGLSFHF
jgi:hypothetical protein